MGPLPFSGSVALATLAAAAASWTEFQSSSGNSPSLLSKSPHRRACLVPREGRALLLLFASRAGPQRRVAVPSVYSINHRRIVIRLCSADLNLAVQVIRPSCEGSRAGRMYHTSRIRKSEFGVFGLPLGHCREPPPKVK